MVNLGKYTSPMDSLGTGMKHANQSKEKPMENPDTLAASYFWWLF